VVVSDPAPGGGKSNSFNFTVDNLAPTVTSLSPASAMEGSQAQTLTINATNSVSALTVTYNAVAHTVTFVSPTELLSASDQAKADSFAVVVTNPAPGGGKSVAVDLNADSPTPTITILTPASVTAGAAAQTQTITGSSFVSTSTVIYNGVAHTVTFVSATEQKSTLRTTDEAKAGTYAAVGTNPAPGGGASNAKNFTVNP